MTAMHYGPRSVSPSEWRRLVSLASPDGERLLVHFLKVGTMRITQRWDNQRNILPRKEKP